jgi:adenylate cyclase
MQFPDNNMNTKIPVILISVLCFELAIMVSSLMKHVENQTIDVFMRWRYLLTATPKSYVHPQLLLVAIDSDTQSKFGRFGAGKWITREPFFRQIYAFDKWFKPSVMLYDIVFEGIIGEKDRKLRISESDSHLLRITEAINKIRENPTECLSPDVLASINTLSMEQGNELLAQALASVYRNAKFPVVLSYYFRGGTVDPQRAQIREWTDEDVFGNDPSGNEEKGRKIPYLKDMAIPLSDIHFPDEMTAQKFNFSPNAVLPGSELLDYSLIGFVNCPRDEDSIIRRIPLVHGFKYRNSITKQFHTVFVPSLALTACLLHEGITFPLREKSIEVFFGKEIIIRPPNRNEIHIPIDESGRMYLNFSAKIEDFPQIRFADLAQVSSESTALKYKKEIENRIVFIGVTATQVDVGPYPLSATSPAPLVHIHLTAVNNILSGNFLRPLNNSEILFILAFVFIVFTSLCCVLESATLGVWSVLFIILYAISAFCGIFWSIVILPIVTPLSYMILCSFGVLTYRYFTEERKRKYIREMFSTMVSDKVLKYLEENPQNFSLSGQQVEATIMFTDISNFTSMAEKVEPPKLTEILNTYFTPVTENILQHDGFVDKYLGDGIMAVWGVPYPNPDHAFEACLSALEQQTIVRSMQEMILKKFGVQLHVRMGVASGQVIAGNMGSSKKFQYTVIGDPVNIASRLEPVNKELGTSIIITHTVQSALNYRIVTRPLGRILLPGKEEIIEIYEPLGLTNSVPAELLKITELYINALEHFYRRNWQDCLAILEKILLLKKDGPSLHLYNITKEYIANPPSDNWKGEYIRKEKR